MRCLIEMGKNTPISVGSISFLFLCLYEEWSRQSLKPTGGVTRGTEMIERVGALIHWWGWHSTDDISAPSCPPHPAPRSWTAEPPWITCWITWVLNVMFWSKSSLLMVCLKTPDCRSSSADRWAAQRAGGWAGELLRPRELHRAAGGEPWLCADCVQRWV